MRAMQLMLYHTYQIMLWAPLEHLLLPPNNVPLIVFVVGEEPHS